MKRKFLAVGLAAAAVVSITCGYMTTAMAAGPVNQTEDEDACDLQDIMESIEDEALRESPAAEITAFAAEIQDTVSGRDLEALAELCDFPISVTMQDGTSLSIPGKILLLLGRSPCSQEVWYMKLELQIRPDSRFTETASSWETGITL